MSDTGPTAIGELGWVQVDCHDPEHLAAFWGEVLGTNVRARLGDPARYVTLEAAAAGAPRLVFQRVPEAKSGKNRLHLDIRVEDLSTAVKRATRLGAAPVPGGDFVEGGVRWCVLTDPEGNEFCLVAG